jgi:hypothetical protein
MKFVLRHATPDERRTVVRAQWLNRVLPRKGRDGSNLGHATARKDVTLSDALTVRAGELLVDELLGITGGEVIDGAGSHVLVVEPAAEPGIVVGWVAFEPGRVVHFVCVVHGYGRRGLGSRLLRKAGAELPRSWSTPNGRALAAAVLSRKENAA